MFAGRKKFWTIGVAIIAFVLIGAGAGMAVATGGDDNEQPITGEALQKATRAALEYTGGGRVTETEAGDEESYYEVEVTLEDGRQVDVQLDENFKVVGGATDGAGGDDDADDRPE